MSSRQFAISIRSDNVGLSSNKRNSKRVASELSLGSLEKLSANLIASERPVASVSATAAVTANPRATYYKER